MVDVFISYPQKERELMLPLKRRLEALGLILFVDVDGRLDGSPTFPEALDKGVRAAKAVLGCWSPWALTRPWVQTECAMAKDENKLVAVERLALSPADVPALFYLVDRKPLTDFLEDYPHEGWAMTLSALATKMRLWADKRHGDPETADAYAKADLLDKAAAAERAALGHTPGAVPRPASAASAPTSPAAAAWAAIESSLDKGHYRRFEKTFETDPAAFLWVIEAEARAKALERWEAVDKSDPDAVAEAIRSGFFPVLEHHAKEAMQRAAMARQAAHEQREREVALERQRQHAAAEAARKAEEERAAKPRRAAEAAKAGRPVAERAFPIELPGVTNWPNPQMIAIPPGRFLMGAPASEEGSGDAESPQHEVRIDYAFALGQHTVTVDAFKSFVAETNHDTGKSAYVLNGEAWKDSPGKGWRDPGFAQTGAHPVCCVNWEDTRAFLAWLNKKAGLEGQPDAYRLPSEAEWEYACRAGTTTPFSFGATISTAQANYDGNYTYGTGKKGEYRQKTMPVGSFPANPFGLHEMHGNVWEWCQDCWNDNYAGAPSDGSAWLTGNCSQRVLRGGSWSDVPSRLRSAYRIRSDPSYRYSDMGFRLARTVFTP